MGQTYPKLYNRDSKGNLRVWFMEIDGDRYRTIAGLDDGVLTSSAWKLAMGKNIGKANETTPARQAILEVEAQYQKKRDRKYYENRDEAAGAKFIAPMLAVSYKDLKSPLTFPVYSQPKLDGIRAIVTRDGITSRQGKPIIACPHILNDLANFFEIYPDAVLDGELYNHNLSDNFNEIASLVRQQKPTDDDLVRSKKMIEFHVYDLVQVGHFWERSLGWDQHHARIGPSIKTVETIFIKTQNDLDFQYGEYLNERYEGQMIRLPNSDYENKRSKGLIKRKEFYDAEYAVHLIEEGQGNWKGYAKSVTCRLADGRLFSAGIRGSREATKALLEAVNAGKRYSTVTIRSPSLTPDGIPRFGVATMFYEGERDL